MKKSSAFFIIVIILLATISEAGAEIYKYTDKDGVIHMTNNPQTIPPEYQGSSQEFKEDKRIDGYTPPVETAITGNETGWEKEGVAASTTRKSMRTMRGFMDSLSSPRMLISIGGAATVIVIALSMILLKKASTRLIVMGMVLGCIYLVLFSFYLRGVMDKGGKVFDSLDKTQAIIQEKNSITNDVIKE